MTGFATAGGRSLLASLALAAALTLCVAGCGSDGSSHVQFPGNDPDVEGELTGVVYGPKSLIEPETAWWPATLGLVSTAYAVLFNETPFGINEAHVTLSSLTQVDAADGRIDSYDPLTQFSPTDADGRYRVISRVVEHLDVCETIQDKRFVGRLLVSADIDLNSRTRAFVVSSQTDIDASTEAVVRLVLRRIFEQEPPVQLCDFSIEGLRNVMRFAENAAFTANGETVNEMNADAFRLISENCKVLQALDDATCRDVDGEEVCYPVNPPHTCVRG